MTNSFRTQSGFAGTGYEQAVFSGHAVLALKNLKNFDLFEQPLEQFRLKSDGQKILDFNSQLMSVNIGHGHPKVIAAMKAQLDRLIYTFPGSATEVRARLSSRLASSSAQAPR